MIKLQVYCTFRELKQQIGAFCYHFWSKHMTKLSHCRKKEDPTPLEYVEGERSRCLILEAVRATEMHMALSCIAMGILQILSLQFAREMNPYRLRYQRTPSRWRISEASVMYFTCGGIFPPFISETGSVHNTDHSGEAGGKVRDL